MTAQSSETSVVPRLAATVILLRDSPSGLQVWLLTRVRGMAFASGMTVFPGGSVDPSDVELPWAGAPPAGLAVSLGCDETRARMLIGAAVRETFEEAGVLLTHPSHQLDQDVLAEMQPEIEAGRLSFGAFLADRGLVVDAAALRPWGRWITPAGEARRYDTHFFVAALPAGARTAALTTEAATAAWVPGADAVAGVVRGERKLLPPTRAMLTSLEPYDTVSDVFAAADARDLSPVCPRRIVEPSGIRIELPDGTIIGRFPRAASGRSVSVEDASRVLGDATTSPSGRPAT